MRSRRTSTPSCTSIRTTSRARGRPRGPRPSSFTIGGLLPLLTILLLPPAIRIPGTFVIVLVALAGTGIVSARIGGASVPRTVTRVVVGGALALGATFLVGWLLGTTGVV